jgi:hypothetical protein
VQRRKRKTPLLAAPTDHRCAFRKGANWVAQVIQLLEGAGDEQHVVATITDPEAVRAVQEALAGWFQQRTGARETVTPISRRRRRDFVASTGKPLRVLAKEHGLTLAALQSRLRRGVPLEDALKKPMQKAAGGK